MLGVVRLQITTGERRRQTRADSRMGLVVLLYTIISKNLYIKFSICLKNKPSPSLFFFSKKNSKKDRLVFV